MNVSREEFLTQTNAMVRSRFEGEGTGHDWYHIDRVRRCALTIARAENADLFIVEMGALLHDIADHKFHDGSLEAGPQVAGEWLSNLGISESDIDRIVAIVKEVSFKGAGVATPMSSLEGACVQDADRLDAIGAIGIARCFAYGGSISQPIYDPATTTVMHDSFDAYSKTKSTSVNHFYEKLLLLKERMNTPKGQEMAAKRHRVMEDFLDQFYSEWNEGE